MALLNRILDPTQTGSDAETLESDLRRKIVGRTRQFSKSLMSIRPTCRACRARTSGK